MWCFSQRLAPFTLICGLLTAACGDLPQPFAHDRGARNPVLTPGADVAGIVVTGITGATKDQEAALTDRMIEALSKNLVPASRVSGNKNSHFLQGHLRTGDKSPLVWELFDKNGTSIKSHEVRARLPKGKWLKDNQKKLDPLVVSAAAAFAEILQRDAVADTGLPAYFLIPVEGVTRQQNAVLLDEMRTVLQRKGFRIADRDTGNQRYLSGGISIRVISDSRRRLNVTWSVLLPDGQLLGLVEQSNIVSAERLKTGWSALSRAIVNSAADGLGVVMIKQPTQSEKSHSSTIMTVR